MEQALLVAGLDASWHAAKGFVDILSGSGLRHVIYGI